MLKLTIICIFIVLICTLNGVCFYLGAIIGQKVAKQEPLKIATPTEKVKRRKEKKEQEYEDSCKQVLWDNIENYDGTSMGQKDIPYRKE